MGERQYVLSNHKKIANIIKQMSGQANMITVPRIYIEFTGDLSTAVVLNQIVYWSDKTKRTDGYFYKSYKEWTDEICLTERQIRYAVKKLKELGFLETELKKANGAPTVHYKLDYDKLLESILTKCQNGNLQNVGMDSDKSAESLTKTTQEITQENTTKTTTIKNQSLLMDEHLGFLTRFYDENIQRMTGYVHQCIQHMLNENNPELVTEAFKIAAGRQPAHPLKYIESTLEKWRNKKIFSVDQLKSEEARRNNAGNQRRNEANGDGHSVDLGF